MSSISMIFCGLICLFGATVAVHLEPSPLQAAIRWAGGWVGAIMVIVGMGKLLFLDE